MWTTNSLETEAAVEAAAGVVEGAGGAGGGGGGVGGAAGAVGAGAVTVVSPVATLEATSLFPGLAAEAEEIPILVRSFWAERLARTIIPARCSGWRPWQTFSQRERSL